MAIIKVDYGELTVGDTELTFVNSSNTGIRDITFHTKNAYAMISDLDHCLGEVKNGMFTLLKNSYPSVFIMSYDITSNLLTLSFKESSTNRNYWVCYESLD